MVLLTMCDPHICTDPSHKTRYQQAYENVVSLKTRQEYGLSRAKALIRYLKLLKQWMFTMLSMDQVDIISKLLSNIITEGKWSVEMLLDDFSSEFMMDVGHDRVVGQLIVRQEGDAQTAISDPLSLDQLRVSFDTVSDYQQSITILRSFVKFMGAYINFEGMCSGNGPYVPIDELIMKVIHNYSYRIRSMSEFINEMVEIMLRYHKLLSEPISNTDIYMYAHIDVMKRIMTLLIGGHLCSIVSSDV